MSSATTLSNKRKRTPPTPLTPAAEPGAKRLFRRLNEEFPEANTLSRRTLSPPSVKRGESDTKPHAATTTPTKPKPSPAASLPTPPPTLPKAKAKSTTPPRRPQPSPLQPSRNANSSRPNPPWLRVRGPTPPSPLDASPSPPLFVPLPPRSPHTPTRTPPRPTSPPPIGGRPGDSPMPPVSERGRRFRQ
ncbi:uncharacterized protein EHS24_006499 [Apiotrichum porosum]|uniref:Uncharacterized protein n=1 Tax=Apiotrichum porosum TaxID=105984 RepID=A0A427Y1I3_9TREE|nr:uncharacterized protein EHS24_006499 [Apiotrichum porosum]RSH84949.1 hypothetical protein EHS24_006499 [Apiotrichum porosum]